MISTFIIAEAGANHNRNIDTAYKLIDVAVDSGADAVKFQTYSSETLYAKNSKDFANYKNINKLIKSLELPREWQNELKYYCDVKGIEFMSTPFDERAVNELVKIGVKRLKIAGFESTDPRFVKMVASTGLPLIVSAGIGFDQENLKYLLSVTEKYNNDLTILHCNNAYPTPIEDVNLKQIQTLKTYVSKVGFSDHTTSTLTPSLAVMLGATVIEKHFTLDKSMNGPDHSFALEPLELNEMVDNIRKAEKTLSYKSDILYTKSEEMFINARRSIVASTFIKKGDLFTEDNITTKRPFEKGCISADEYYNIINQQSTDDYEPDDFILGV